MKSLAVCAFALALLAGSPAIAKKHDGGNNRPHRVATHSAHRNAHGTSAHHRAVHRRVERRVHRQVHNRVHHRVHRAVHRRVEHRVHRKAGNRKYAHYRRAFRARRRYRIHAYRRPHGWYRHRWTLGERLPRAWFARDYWIVNFGLYGLIPPPYGLVWVRVGPNALLIEPATGLIVRIEYDLFW